MAGFCLKFGVGRLFESGLVELGNRFHSCGKKQCMGTLIRSAMCEGATCADGGRLLAG